MATGGLSCTTACILNQRWVVIVSRRLEGFFWKFLLVAALAQGGNALAGQVHRAARPAESSPSWA